MNLKLKRYIIIGTQRSGTTAVHFALYNHPETSTLYDEARIVPLFTDGLSTFTFGNNDDEEKINDVSELFNIICTLNSKGSANTIGLKIANSNPNEIALLKETLFSQFKDVKIIFVYRSNLTAQFGSLARGKKTKQFHSWDKKATKIDKIKLNTFEFKIHIIKYVLSNLELELFSNDFSLLKVNYEEIIKKNNFNYIFNFLNLKHINESEIKSTKKISPEAEQYVVDYERFRKIEIDFTQKIKENPKKYLRILDILTFFYSVLNNMKALFKQRKL